MDKCQGPCLTHCYSNNKITYLMLGIFIGLVFGSLLLKEKKFNNLSNLS